jgi:hypothetical protein
MLVSYVQSIYIGYIRTLFIFNESSRDCATEQYILHQNCVQGTANYNSVFFVQSLQHESCSSISNLWSLQWRLFALWQISALKCSIVRRNETQRNNERCGKLLKSLQRQYKVSNIPELQLHPAFCSSDLIVLRAVKRHLVNCGASAVTAMHWLHNQ